MACLDTHKIFEKPLISVNIVWNVSSLISNEKAQCGAVGVKRRNLYLIERSAWKLSPGSNVRTLFYLGDLILIGMERTPYSI